VRAEYVWGSLGPVARIAGGRVQLYVCDALGHVRALIDAETGQITDRYDYDAWGNVVHNGSTRQPFVGTGRMGTSGFLKSASIMWVHAPTTLAPQDGCSATR